MRTSRELSERVEIEFYRRPRWFWRVTWVTAGVLAVLSTAWLVAETSRGRRQIYQAGPLATPHQLFENDCQQCHTAWAPLGRLTSLDESVSSVTNEKCMRCHSGPAHHENQIPAHENISCAKCHREHEGDKALAWVADRHCIDCHGDLNTTDGPSETFVTDITRFGASSGDGAHPEFAVHRLLAGNSPQAGIGSGHRVFSVIDSFRREGDESARWQDKAQIRFNHAAHLKAELPVGRDENGNVVYQTLRCQDCHRPDAARRYMQPINYEQHCADCHPLFFDVEGFPNQSVPHETPEVVLGYLTEVYTLRALEQSEEGEAPDEPNKPELSEDRIRKLPGRRYRELLTDEQAEWLKSQVRQAEQQVQQHTHTLFGYEAQGGCRYCHTVSEPAQGASWGIEPPNIPQRWYAHSTFRHDSHRMLACTECHRDFVNGKSVAESTSTGDVLLPPIEQCLACHAGKKDSGSSLISFFGRGGGTEQRPSDSSLGTARNSCVECHTYHNYEGEDFDGPLNLHLRSAADQPDKTEVAESSK